MIRPFSALPHSCGAWPTRSSLERRSLWLGGCSGTIAVSNEIKEAGNMLGSAGLFFGIASLVFGIVLGGILILVR